MLFDNIFPEEQAGHERDGTQINQVILYFSDEELIDFKRLSKVGMLQSNLDLKTANVSDFLLILLKNTYANTES